MNGLLLLAVIAFGAAAVVAGISKAYAVALVALGLTLTTLSALGARLDWFA